MIRMAQLPIAALKWPLAVSSSGNFEVCSTVHEAWGLRMRVLLSTRFSERAMRTDYGCGLLDALFSPTSTLSAEDEVRRAVSKWLPRLTVQKVEVAADDEEVTVRVLYKTPDGSLEEMYETYRSGAQL